MKRTRIVVEHREVRIVSIDRPLASAWCEQCGATVSFVSPEVAARVAQQPVRALVERAKAGELHVSDTAVAGLRLVCLASLLDLP
jgi:hypothetical protein